VIVILVSLMVIFALQGPTNEYDIHAHYNADATKSVMCGKQPILFGTISNKPTTG
jgi:hypothetical protein